MKFVKCDVAEVQKANKNNKLMEMVQDFYKSDMEVARMEYSEDEYKNSNYCATAVRTAVNRCRIPSVRVMTRKDNVYLVKVSALEKE